MEQASTRPSEAPRRFLVCISRASARRTLVHLKPANTSQGGVGAQRSDFLLVTHVLVCLPFCLCYDICWRPPGREGEGVWRHPSPHGRRFAPYSSAPVLVLTLTICLDCDPGVCTFPMLVCWMMLVYIPMFVAMIVHSNNPIPS